jgi:hypothetical protein
LLEGLTVESGSNNTQKSTNEDFYCNLENIPRDEWGWGGQGGVGNPHLWEEPLGVIPRLSDAIDLCESENEGRNASGQAKGLAFVCRIAGWEPVEVRGARF